MNLNIAHPVSVKDLPIVLIVQATVLPTQNNV